MKKTKAIATFVFSLVLVAALATAAFADIAYEPGDSFFRKHASGCAYENRSYYTNGENGYVTVYTQPGGGSQTAIPNGGIFYISYTYEEKGETWGCLEYDKDTLENRRSWQENLASGWVKMSQMQAEHDSRWFEEEYGDRFSGETAKLEIGKDQKALGYQHPGSGVVVAEIGNYTSEDFVTVDFSTVYTDAQGLKWGYLSYFFGHRNLWICLSEPYEVLPAGEEYAEPELIPAAEPGDLDEARKEASRPTAYLLAGAAGVVLITGTILVFVLRKRKG